MLQNISFFPIDWKLIVYVDRKKKFIENANFNF